MPDPLTADHESLFISYFGPPRAFPGGKDHRPAARALLEALKRVSATLGLRVEVERLDPSLPQAYPRIHGVMPSRDEPILWSMCAPANDPFLKPAHYKLEILPRQTEYLRKQRVFAAVAQIARSARILPASRKLDAILTIGITPALTDKWVDSIADAVLRIAAEIAPVYP